MQKTLRFLLSLFVVALFAAPAWPQMQQADTFVISRLGSSGKVLAGVSTGFCSRCDLRSVAGKQAWLTFDYMAPPNGGCDVYVNNCWVGRRLGNSVDWRPVIVRFDSRLLRGFGDVVSISPVPLVGQTLIDLSWRNVLVHAAPAEPEVFSMYKLSMHNHSTYSDGSETIAEKASSISALGFDGMLLSDHDEQIDLSRKAWYGFVLGKKVAVGYSNYVADCRRYSTRSFLIIPGLEHTTKWYSSPGVVESSHSLLFPLTSSQPDQELVRLNSAFNATAAVMVRGIVDNMITAAAHPELVAQTAIPWEPQRDRFDFNSYVLPQLLEVNNSKSPDQESKVKTRFLTKKTDAGVPFVPYSGSDSHGWGDPKDKERKQRATFVFAKALTVRDICDGISMGLTMASSQGLRPLSACPCPSTKTWYCIAAPSFSYRFAFYDWSTGRKQVVSPVSAKVGLYRDGQLVPGSQKAITKGQKGTIVYNAIDTYAPVGEHWYAVSVDNVFLTAQFCVDVLGY